MLKIWVNRTGSTIQVCRDRTSRQTDRDFEYGVRAVSCCFIQLTMLSGRLFLGDFIWTSKRSHSPWSTPQIPFVDSVLPVPQPEGQPQ